MRATNGLAPKISAQHLQYCEQVLERELEWLKTNERIQFYQPNAPIHRLIDLVGSKPNIVYVLSAANGIGKTTALVNIAGNLIFGPQNSFFRHPIFENWPYPKIIRFVSEPSQVEEGGPLPSEIAKWWPKGRYRTFKDSRHYVSRYQAGDWVLEVKTYEQAPEQHEGANVGLVLFNEPPPENLWTPNISRLRAGGLSIVGMTPLTEAGWFFDKVVPRHEPFVIYADVETACKQHGTRGHLDHDQIERMIGEYSDDEREARIDGKAMYLKGLIYKTFNSQVHVLREAIEAPANATIYQVVDPHEDKPFAVIWAMVDGKGDIYIVDEWPNVEFTKWHNCRIGIEEYVRIFRDKEHGMEVHKRIIDRHFAEISHFVGMTRKTLRDQFAEQGIDFYPSYKAEEEIDTGILRVKDYLKYAPERPIDWNNKPKLFINPHCMNTIKAFGKWARDPKTAKVQDAYKDFMDVVRYLIMDNPEVDRPIPYEAPQKRWG